jgi:hypothetical protein
MVNSCVLKTMGTAVIDDITFTPGPAQPEVVRPGILLKSGSFLAGENFHINATDAFIVHDDKQVIFKTEQVAAGVYHPVTMHQIAAAGQSGVILLNGDFLASDINDVGAANGGGMVQMNSVAIGAAVYYSNKVCACVANAVQSMPSDYEIRLRDGSIIRTKSVELAGDKLTLHEVSGISIDVDPSEIAQVRAGLNRVQPLIDLPWKVSGLAEAKKEAPPTAAAPKPVPAATSPAAPTVPAASAAPAAQPAVASQTPPAAITSGTGTTNAPAAAVADNNKVQGKSTLTPVDIEAESEVMKWMGPNREQILVLPAGAKVEVPLSGKFRALAMGLALAPGASSNAEIGLHVLVEGKEVGNAEKLKAGDQPRCIRFAVSDPKSVTLVVDKAGAGTRLLLLDPVAVRETALTPPPSSPPAQSSPAQSQTSAAPANASVHPKNFQTSAESTSIARSLAPR